QCWRFDGCGSGSPPLHLAPGNQRDLGSVLVWARYPGCVAQVRSPDWVRRVFPVFVFLSALVELSFSPLLSSQALPLWAYPDLAPAKGPIRSEVPVSTAANGLAKASALSAAHRPVPIRYNWSPVPRRFVSVGVSKSFRKVLFG